MLIYNENITSKSDKIRIVKFPKIMVKLTDNDGDNILREYYLSTKKLIYN